jgi:hypothetical protein
MVPNSYGYSQAPGHKHLINLAYNGDGDDSQYFGNVCRMNFRLLMCRQKGTVAFQSLLCLYPPP